MPLVFAISSAFDDEAFDRLASTRGHVAARIDVLKLINCRAIDQ